MYDGTKYNSSGAKSQISSVTVRPLSLFLCFSGGIRVMPIKLRLIKFIPDLEIQKSFCRIACLCREQHKKGDAAKLNLEKSSVSGNVFVTD